MVEKKPTFLRWLRQNKACAREYARARSTGSLDSTVIQSCAFSLRWLSVSLGDVQLQNIAWEMGAVHKRFHARLQEMDLPWKDGRDAKWRTK